MSAITPQAVSMGLQLEQLKLQNDLAKAEIGKTSAEGEKIKEETKKTGTETKNIEQQIEKSKTKVKDIIAGIPAKEQQYYVEKANQELMESTRELNETIKSVNKRKEKNMELESHDNLPIRPYNDRGGSMESSKPKLFTCIPRNKRFCKHGGDNLKNRIQKRITNTSIL